MFKKYSLIFVSAICATVMLLLCMNTYAGVFMDRIVDDNHARVVSISELWGFEFSPDGVHSCITSRLGAFLLDQDFKIIHHYKLDSYFTNHSCFSPDGKRLLLSSEYSSTPYEVRRDSSYLYEIQNQKRIHLKRWQKEKVHLQPFSPDSQHLIITNSATNQIETIDLNTGMRRSYPGITPNDFIFFSSDNKHFVAAQLHGDLIDDASLYLEHWDRQSGAMIQQVLLQKIEHQQPVAHKGRFFVVGEGPEDNSFVGYLILQYPIPYPGRISDMWITPILWEGATGEVKRKWPELYFYWTEPPEIDLSRDGRWLAFANVVIDLKSDSGSVIHIPHESLGRARHNSIHPSQPLFYKKTYTFGSSSIEAWNVEDGHLQHSLSLLYQKFLNGALSTHSSLLAICHDSTTLNIWDFLHGKHIIQLVPSNNEHTFDYTGSSDFSPDGRYLLWGGMNSFSLWETDTWQLLSEQETGIQSFGTLVKFSPDGKTYATTEMFDESNDLYRTVLRSTDDSAFVRNMTLQQRGITSIDFSSDGRLFASAGNNVSVAVYDVEREEFVNTYAHHRTKVASIYFFPDSTRIVSAAVNGTVYIWDALTGEIFDMRVDLNTPVVLTPDGHHLICGSVVYDAQTLDSVLNLEEERKDYQKMFISRDGSIYSRTMMRVFHRKALPRFGI